MLFSVLHGSPGFGPAPRHRQVTTEPARGYETHFQPAARRAIAQRLPETVAAAVLKFCDATLAGQPSPGRPAAFGPLTGCHGARRGTYRIVYRIDESLHLVHVLDIDHRSEIYHRPQR